MKYLHNVQYYETDKMGVVHHSNYIRWFEEARVAFLEEIGLPYGKMEDEGISSPVVKVECRYIKPAVFGETAEIETEVTELGNVRFAFSYRVTDKTGVLLAEGASLHCFTNIDGKFISLKKERPEWFAILAAEIGRNEK